VVEGANVSQQRSEKETAGKELRDIIKSVSAR